MGDHRRVAGPRPSTASRRVRLAGALAVFIAASVCGAGCGWSSCGGLYIVEGPECVDPTTLHSSVAPFAPCAGASRSCPALFECLPSVAPFAETEPLCTLRCERDADCGGWGRPARCVGAPGARLCHPACERDADCAAIERCVPAGDSAVTVCAPYPQRYQSCSATETACAAGLTCATTSDADRLCTQQGCARNEDCPDHGALPVVCVSGPRGSFCALGCLRDDDCYARGTVCSFDGALTARNDLGGPVGACVAR